MTFKVRKSVFSEDEMDNEAPIISSSSLPFDFTMKLTGVTFEGRQPYVSRLYSGEELSVRAVDDNPYDKNCIELFDPEGNSVGFVPKERNQGFRSDINKGYVFSAKVEQVTGGGTYNYGVVVRFTKSFVQDAIKPDTKPVLEIKNKAISRADKPKRKSGKEFVVLGYGEYYSFLNDLKEYDHKVVYVYHKRFHLGRVITMNNDFITVKFDSVGDKTFKFPDSINVHLFKCVD